MYRRGRMRSLFEHLAAPFARRLTLREFNSGGRESDTTSATYFEERTMEARVALGGGDKASAMEICNKLQRLSRKLCMTSPRARLLMLGLGLLDELESLMEEQRKQKPNDPHPWAGLAMVARARGNMEEALRLCEHLRDKFPYLSDGYTIAASCLSDAGKGAEAERLLAQAVKRMPEDVDIRIEYAVYAERRGDLEAALDRWSAAKQLKSFPQVVFGTAGALRRLGRLDEAKATVAEVLQKTPGNHYGWIEMAFIATAEGDLDGVANAWAHVRKCAPRFARAYIDGAQAVRAAGRPGEADDILCRGIEQLETDLPIHLEYARNADRAIDPAAAVERWALVRSRFPDSEEAREHA